ncbi:MAG: hypothetical protein U9R49_10705 [Bacteroidota bacterium]|nr:hypothetical protein [Bacteroidota bacterium]
MWSQEPGSWTHFRGSDLNGISNEKGFPSSWSDSMNIAWKVQESGQGWSSLVVLGKQVVYHCQTGKQGNAGHMCGS